MSQVRVLSPLPLVKRSLFAAIVIALLAGAVGNIASRQVFGPTRTELLHRAAVDAAVRSKDQVQYERAAGAAAVDIAPREMAFTMGPFIAVLGGYALVIALRRRRSGDAPPAAAQIV